MNITDIEKEQNREFIASIYSRYKNYLFSLAYRYFADPSDCDDIVQDAVIRLMQNIAILRRLDDCQMITYVNMTVRSVALDALDRKKRRQRLFEDEPFEQAILHNVICDATNSVEEAVLTSEQSRAVRNAMNRLPERFEMLIIGRYYLHLTDEELAALHGCQRQSLRTVMKRAKLMMQKELEKEGITDDKT